MKEISLDDIKIGLANKVNQQKFYEYAKNLPCFFCGKNIDYYYFKIKGNEKDLFIGGYQRGINGKQEYLCQKCFRLSCKLDNIITIILKIITKFR